MKFLALSFLFIASALQAAVITGSVKSVSRHIPEYGEDIVEKRFVTSDGKTMVLPRWINVDLIPAKNTIVIVGERNSWSLTKIESLKVILSEDTHELSSVSGILTTDGENLVLGTNDQDIALPNFFVGEELVGLNVHMTLVATLGWGTSYHEGRTYGGTRPILRLGSFEVRP